MKLKYFQQFLLLTVFIMTGALAGEPEPPQPKNIDNPWPGFKTPARGKAQAIGSYIAGCLVGGEELPPSGPGYHLMHPSTGKHFGHPRLIHYLKDLGQRVHDQKLGTLLVGNLNLPRGGPTLVGHRSHQTGLDVDIWYWLNPAAEKSTLTVQEREDWGAKSVVDQEHDLLIPDLWSPRHIEILKAAAEAKEVERIFVNPVIKRELCQQTRKQSKKTKKWMAKIRPWFEHHDHFHVRLSCPKDSPSCKRQDPPASGDGCDASLNWWFTAEAKDKSASKERKEEAYKMPVLPPECDGVRAQSN